MDRYTHTHTNVRITRFISMVLQTHANVSVCYLLSVSRHNTKSNNNNVCVAIEWIQCALGCKDKTVERRRRRRRRVLTLLYFNHQSTHSYIYRSYTHTQLYYGISFIAFNLYMHSIYTHAMAARCTITWNTKILIAFIPMIPISSSTLASCLNVCVSLSVCMCGVYNTSEC